MSQLGFYIGNFFVAYYGLLMTAGILTAAVVGYFQIKKYRKNYDDFILICAVGSLGGIIGAKILYLLVSLDKIDFSKIGDPQYLNFWMSGGFVFYGGLIGGLAGLYVCKKYIQVDVNSIVSIAIPCLPIAHGFGRIGCSLVGCCYGKPYNGWGAITYLNSPIAPNQQPLFPVQLTEAAFDFFIALFLLVRINRYSSRGGLKLYLILYAAGRIVLEFFRFDNAERGLFLHISTSQYISFILIVCTILYHYRQKKLSTM